MTSDSSQDPTQTEPFSELANGSISLRISRGYKIFTYIFVPPMLVLAGWLAQSPLQSGWSGNVRDYMSVGMGITLFTIMLYSLLGVMRTRLVLDPESICLIGLLRSKSIRHNQVAGFRILPTPHIATLRFVANSPEARDLDVLLEYERKDEFLAWASRQFINIDAREQAAEQERLLNDEHLGKDQKERLHTLLIARRWAIGYGVFSFGFFWWGLFRPEPYGLTMAIAMLLPLLGVSLVFHFRGAIQFDEIDNSPAPSVAFGFLMSVFLLMIRGAKDWSFLDWHPLIFPSIGIGVLLILAVVFADPAVLRNRVGAISIAVFCLIYGIGASLFLNGYLGKEVLEKTSAIVYTMSHNGECQHIRIAPTGTYLDGDELQLPKRLEKILQAGDVVDVIVKDGWLGATRYVIVPSGS